MKKYKLHTHFLSKKVLEKYEEKIKDIIETHNFKSDFIIVTYSEKDKSIVIGDLINDLDYNKYQPFEILIYCPLYQFQYEENYYLYEEMIEKIDDKKREIENFENILKNDNFTLMIYDKYKNRIIKEIKLWFEHKLIITDVDVFGYLNDENREKDILDEYELKFYNIDEFNLYLMALNELTIDNFCKKMLQSEDDLTYCEYNRYSQDNFLIAYCKILENEEIDFEDFFDKS